MQKTKTLTVMETIRLYLSTRNFVMVKNGEQVAEGFVVTPLNSDVILCDLKRGETTTTHSFDLKQTIWDELTQTGWIWGDDPKNGE